MSEKRIEIMDAAERRIRAAGYNGFSFRDIALDVGVKSSSIHYYFPTKEDLGVAVARRYTDRFFEGLSDASSSPETHLSEAFGKAMERDGQMCLCGVLGTASTSLPGQVPVRHRHLNLPQQTHNLISRMLLSSCHEWLLSYQFVSLTLVQKQPGIPVSFQARSWSIHRHVLGFGLAGLDT